MWAPVWAEDSRDHSSVPDTLSVAVGRVARDAELDTVSDTVSVWVWVPVQLDTASVDDASDRASLDRRLGCNDTSALERDDNILRVWAFFCVH